MDLNGKTALVTGGAKRLGRAIALELARNGVNIALHYGSSKREARQTQKDVIACGVGCRLYQADLTDPRQVKKLAETVWEELKGIDILVNSAAVFPRVSMAKAKVSDYDLPYAVNLRAPALLTQYLGLRMARRKKPGRIVNIADVGGRLAWPGYLPYSLSKAGLLQLNRTSAKALAPHVLVNAILPGPMLAAERDGQRQISASKKRTLLKRLGGTGEIARAVRFVAESDFMCGAEVAIDGGRSLI